MNAMELSGSAVDPAHRSLPCVAVDVRALVRAPSGIGVYTQSLLQRLAQRGRARYAAMSHREIADPGPLERFGVSLESQRGPLGVWWQQFTLPRRLRRGDVDLLWSPITTLPLRLPVPAVVTIHDLTVLVYPKAHRLKVRLSVLPFLARSVSQARRIAVDSSATADDLRRYFPGCADRVEVVYPGIDPDFHPATSEQIAAFRHQIDCPDGYLLFAGTLEPRKNLHSLLAAWQKLRGSRPGTPPLILAGPYGWRSRDLMRRIDELADQDLRYLGRVPRARLVELMQAASVFAYPSLYEGFGLPPAEAMACGIPIVTSDRSSLPEVVGDAALLVDPEDPEALAAALCKLLDEPSLAAELGERARQRARRFDWSASAETLEGLFFEALD